MNQKHRLNIYLLSLILSVSMILSSCKDTTEYQCRIINTTDYYIDKIVFSCSVEEVEMSVGPQETTAFFEMKYQSGGGGIAEPMVCIRVSNYSDTTSAYTNDIGGMMSASDMDPITTFVIELDPNPYNATDIFKVRKR